MKPVAGLWIDHRKATVVILSDEGEVTKQILSKVEKQNGRLDGVRSVQPYESLLVASDDKQLRDFSGHLDVFYKEVLESVKDAESVLLLGPGEAKDEMKKFMEKTGNQDRVAAVETVDKLTDHQIAAKVRGFFEERITG